MTCNGDCKDCPYGERIPVKWKCNADHGVTCNSDCDNCPYCLTITYQFVCKERTIPYRGG